MIWIKRLSIPLIVIFSSAFLLYAAEFFLSKYIGLGQPIVYDKHLLWGYSPKSNKIYSRFKDSTVSINNVGLRSSENWISKEKNILFLGDSVTYGGSYIDDKDTFSSITCSKLKGWKCFNGGVNAYGILNIVARSKYDDRIQQDNIRIFTFITDDFDRGLQKSSTAHFILREPPKLFPALWELSNFIASKIQPKKWFGKNSKNKSSEDIIEHQKLLNRSFALEILISEIERLKSLEKSFLLIHSPSRTELNNPKILEDNIIIKILSKKFPNDFIILSEIFSNKPKKNQENIFKDDVHYQKIGHQIVGEFLGKILSNKIN